MERADIDSVEPRAVGGDSDCRRLADSLDADDLAVNRYRIAPGEGFPSGLHAHGDQEEVFVVLDGEATFETLGPEKRDGREVTVGAGEAVRFAPGEYQSGRNAGDGDLVALALGAPRDSDDVRIPLDCPACSHDYLRPEAGGGDGGSQSGVVLTCPACGAENVPEGCPACGTEMRVALGESDDGRAETVVVCPDCGAEAGTPFRR
jgi:mannose-6-phosphate isomerase-like protein (cupin superfamily)